MFVHDLIPLLFPELSGDCFAAVLRGILASVDVARDWIICASECTRGDLCRRLPIDPARVFVIPLAADDALFHPVDDPDPIRCIRHRCGIGDRPYLLSLATIEPRKNLAHLIRCFSRLVRDPTIDDGLRLVLAGATGLEGRRRVQAFEGVPASGTSSSPDTSRRGSGRPVLWRRHLPFP
jgi:glycosyltransferase involved in cell wall biosynthesis